VAEVLVAHSTGITAYSDALVVLGTAAIIVPVVRRLGLSPVLGYLGAGALLGPLGLGSFVGSLPILYWFTITDAQNVAGIAELGIVFLLFLIGLELSLDRLLTLRRLVFGLGGLQVLLSSVILGGALTLLGQKPSVGIILGANLALSSTAIVLELLSNQKRLPTSAGRASFSVLLAQDLAVIPILVFLSILGRHADGSILASLASAMLAAGIGLTAIIVVGRLLLRPLFRLVGSVQSNELFIAAVLLVIVGSGVVANVAGLSMALGAFVAGLMLTETEYRKAIESTVEPFKGLLLGIFFFTIGMNIDVRTLAEAPVWFFASVAALITAKAFVVIVLGRLFRLSWPAAVETGLLLGPAGEFAFVGINMASSLKLVPFHVSSFALTVVSVSMALTPALSAFARRLAPRLAARAPADPALSIQPPGGAPHVILIGYGRVGKVVSSLFEHHKVPYIAVDYDARSVTYDRREGHKVYFGDATDPAFLQACGLTNAPGVIITVGVPDMVDSIVAHVRALRPDALIITRARDAEHARHLYGVGATDVVPETIEASLQLSEAALIGLGIPTGLVIASIHEERDRFRHTLQQAAQAAGQTQTHGVRAKSIRISPKTDL
jgi:CPA2 family monovalent cation:H+ antiporter-2